MKKPEQCGKCYWIDSGCKSLAEEQPRVLSSDNGCPFYTPLDDDELLEWWAEECRVIGVEMTRQAEWIIKKENK